MTNRKGTRTVTVRLSVDIDVDVEVSKDNETNVIEARVVGGDVWSNVRTQEPVFVQRGLLDQSVIDAEAIEAAECADYDDAEGFEADLANDREAEERMGEPK